MTAWLVAVLVATVSYIAPAHAVLEAQLSRDLSGRIEPFFAASTLEFIPGEESVKLALRRFINPNAIGVVLLIPGYSEALSKYSEIAFDLYHAGYSVVVYDHRGQGSSTRLLDDPKRAHIDDFRNLVRDLRTINTQVLSQLPPGPRFALANSMGGAVLAGLLEEPGQNYSAAVLAAPMFQISLHPVVEALLPWALEPFVKLGIDKFYVRGPRDPLSFTYEANRVSQSEARYMLLQQRSAERTPEAQVWGVTAGWLYQALKGTEIVRTHADQITAPLLILQAENDAFVVPQAQVDFCNKAKNCHLERLSNSKHEILIETDSVRQLALQKTLDFFAAHSR